MSKKDFYFKIILSTLAQTSHKFLTQTPSLCLGGLKVKRHNHPTTKIYGQCHGSLPPLIAKGRQARQVTVTEKSRLAISSTLLALTILLIMVLPQGSYGTITISNISGYSAIRTIVEDENKNKNTKENYEILGGIAGDPTLNKCETPGSGRL